MDLIMSTQHEDYAQVSHRSDLLCLIILWLFCTTALSAQRLSFKHLTVEDGLSQNTITDIYQDSLGTLWVATQNGLNRFDGYTFETFESSNSDSLTLSSNSINCLERGSGTTLWIGTKEGLCLWDQRLGRISRMHRYFKNDTLNGQYTIGDILVDSDGGVWVMGEDKGFHIFYKGKEEEFFRKKLSLKNRPGNTVGFYGQFLEDLSGNIWIGTSRFGIWVFNKRDKGLSHVDINPGKEEAITSLLQDKKGNIWVGTLGGLMASTDHGNTFKKIPELKNTIIRCLYLDQKSRVWVGTDDKGLLLYHDAQKSFTAFDHSISDPTSLLHNSIRCVLLDDQEILWVGTYAGGLNYNNPYTNAFQTYQSGTSNRDLSNNSVTGFAEDKAGNLWVTTDRGGLNILNFKTGTFRYLRADPKNPATISSDIIQHIRASSNGNFWIGHWSHGLDYYDSNQQRFYNFSHQANNPESLSSNSIHYILEDSKNHLWLATNAGLNIVDRSQLKNTRPPALAFKVFKNDLADSSSLSDNFVKTIFEDSQGRIWVGTWQGLNLWEPASSTFLNFKNNPKELKLFTDDYIFCIAQGLGSNMLLGTNERGLIYYMQEADSVIYFNKQNDFPSNTILGIQQDFRGLWWISTTNGLVRFNEQRLTFTHFNRHDGLPSNEFRFNANAKLADGRLVFGGNNGMVIFHPDSIKKNALPPKVFLTQFKLFNDVIAPGNKALPTHVSLTSQIKLPYHQSTIGFQFVGVNFTASEKNTYAYQLQGIDKDWNHIGSQRAANFSYVPPGEYVFRVKAANSDGVWSAPVDLRVIIAAPWWATGWFKTITLFTLVVSLIAAHKLRTRSLRNKKELLEKLISERTIELEQKNEILTLRQEEITRQKQELLVQRDSVNQQYQTIQSLSEIGQKITASLKKEELILQLYNILSKLMDVDHFSIGHLDQRDRVLEFSAIKRSSTQIEEAKVSLDEDRFSVLCVEQKKVIHISDLKTEYAKHFQYYINRYSDGHASAIYVPLFLPDGAITGVLVVRSFQLNAYSEVHVNTLKNLAAYIGIAFENANFYKAIEAQSALLARQSRQLEELNNLKTRFFINISHEFRTPLTLIITPLAQMLAEGSSKDWPRMYRQLVVMHKNAKQLLQLINELLEIRNLETAGTPKITASEADIITFTKSTLGRFEEFARQLDIELTLTHDNHGKIMAWFDPDLIQKVLTNLYSNAFKYTSRGGHIETTIGIRTDEYSDYATISIRDNGAGIDESEIPFVFERFYQGDEPVNSIQKGSGIGLSLTKDLVDLHAGKIEVESQKGTGTTFTILLPIQKKNQENTYQHTPKVELLYSDIEELNGVEKVSPEKSNELSKILVVEDNTDVRELLRDELSADFCVFEANDGRQGIEASLRHVPDLVLSDVMMPVADGIALCDFLKTDERTSHIPVILLTAKSGENSQIQGLNIGADDYISKPFNIKILKARIHNLIASRKKLHILFSSRQKVKIREVVENIQDRNFLEKIDDQITKHIKNPELNHEILSREIGMSKTQLYRKLQSITGKTVHEYIRNFRLRTAHEILNEKPETLIFEVAYEVGFKDPSYFSKCFYAFYNVWPNTVKRGNSAV